MQGCIIGRAAVRFAAAALALSVSASAPPAAGAQALGRLYIEALDDAGQPVPGLTTSDFVVVENDVRARIVSAQPVGPLKVALLIDNGDRMSQRNALNPLQDAVRTFLDTLGPQHQVALFTIARNVQRRMDFTTDREALRAAAEDIHLDTAAGTILLDGIREIRERHYAGDETLPVMVIILTDGAEQSQNYSDRAYRELVETLIADSVMVHVLQVSGGSRSGSSSAGGAGIMRGYARNIAENTGGVYETLSEVTGMPEWMRRYAERLNAHHAEMSKRYRVLYEPPEPRGPEIAAGARPGVNIRLFVDLRPEGQ